MGQQSIVASAFYNGLSVTIGIGTKDNSRIIIVFAEHPQIKAELLEQTGITCEEMKDPDSRKLIFVNEDRKLKFFMAKGPDVPTYVEYGAADIGVVGKDTLVEEGRKMYEVLVYSSRRKAPLSLHKSSQAAQELPGLPDCL